MMKKMTALLLGAMLVLTLLPAAAMAAPSVSIMMRNVEITDGDNVTYYLNDGEGGVTPDNADGNNYNVKYEPATATLTLNNAYILGKQKTYGGGDGQRADAVKTEGDVNIVLEGMSTLQGGEAPAGNSNSNGIFINSGSITISGNGALNALGGDGTYSNGICGKTITIESGLVNARGGAGKYVSKSYGLWCESLTVNGGALNAVGQSAAHAYGGGIHFSSDNNATFVISGGMVEARSDNSAGGGVNADWNIASNKAPDVSKYADYFWSGDGALPYKHGTVDPLSYITTWKTFVIAKGTGGVDVVNDTGNNDALESKYYWDGSAKTLTLKEGFSFITLDLSQVELPAGSTIVLEGNATVISGSGQAVGDDTYGIKCAGDLTIKGTGTLNTISNDASGEGYGIYADGSITLEGATVNAISCANAGVGIKAKNVTLNSGTVNASGRMEGVAADLITVAGGGLGCFGEKNGLDVLDGEVKLSSGAIDARGRMKGIIAKTIELTGGDIYAVGAEAVSLTTAPGNAVALGSVKYNDAVQNLKEVAPDASGAYSVPSDTVGEAAKPVKTLTLSALTPGGSANEPRDDGHNPPTIVAPSKDTEVELEAGESGALSVSALDATGFQWQMRVPDGNWQDISRATGATLTVSGDAEDGTEYRCFASNSYGNTASKTFTVRVAEAATVVEPTVEPPQTGDGHTVAGYVMLALLALVTAAATYRKKRA